MSGESLDDTTTLFNPSSYSSNPDKVLQKLLMSRSVEAHRHLLMILYHMPFDISVEDFDTIRAPLKNLALTADMYGSYPLVGPHIDRQLLPFKSSETALKTCIDFPSELIEFAVLVRSDWIFKHTFVHLLSRPSVWNDHHTALDSMGLGSLFSRKAEAFLDDVKELALHFLTFPYESTNWPMKLAEYSLRSISAELYRTINERNCTTFRWIQIVRFLATSNDLRLKTTELPNLVEGKHTQREISLIEKSIKCHILASKCCTTLFLANPTNVDTMCQPGAGTNIAPLVCFEITDDDLPWKNASSWVYDRFIFRGPFHRPYLELTRGSGLGCSLLAPPQDESSSHILDSLVANEPNDLASHTMSNDTDLTTEYPKLHLWNIEQFLETFSKHF